MEHLHEHLYEHLYEQLLRRAASSMCAVLRKEACAIGALIGLPRFNNEYAKVFVKMLVKVFVKVFLTMLYKKLNK